MSPAGVWARVRGREGERLERRARNKGIRELGSRTEEERSEMQVRREKANTK